MRDQMTSNREAELTAPTRIGSSVLLGDFVRLLQKQKAKLRAGAKTVCNMKTMKLRHLPTIEIKVSARKWLPLKMPDDRWYFETEKERDEMLMVLKSPNVS